jgi:hypothetical protein
VWGHSCATKKIRTGEPCPWRTPPSAPASA